MKVKLCYHEDSEKRKILDLFPRVQAADFDTQNGVRIGKGGAYIGYIADGDYIGYKQINFGPSGSTKSILFHYARINNGGNAKFRIGSSNGTLIGDTLVLPSTGSYDNYETLKVTLNQDVAGLNDLYIVGRSFNYEWFELSDLE
jgi:beta-glucosidase